MNALAVMRSLSVAALLSPLASFADDMVIEAPAIARDLPRLASNPSCGGQNLSPGIAWRSPPRGATAMGILLEVKDDERASQVHWVVYNVAAERGEIREGEAQTSGIGITVGRNSRGDAAFAGACHVGGSSSRRLVLTVVATDLSTTELPEGLDRDGLERALTGHVLATARIVGGTDP